MTLPGDKFWGLESDKAKLGMLIKLSEEASELSQRAARAAAQGLLGIDPDSHLANYDELCNKFTDVTACIDKLGLFLRPERYRIKLLHHSQWMESLRKPT